MAEGEAYSQQDYANFDGQNGDQYEESSGAYVQEKMEGQETTEDQGSGDDESKDDGNEDARFVVYLICRIINTRNYILNKFALLMMLYFVSDCLIASFLRFYERSRSDLALDNWRPIWRPALPCAFIVANC